MAARKGPKTFSGMLNKMVTGDGRKKPESMLGNIFGAKKKRK